MRKQHTKQNFDFYEEERRLVALRSRIITLFPFSLYFHEWIAHVLNEIDPDMNGFDKKFRNAGDAKAKKALKEFFHTSHRDHQEWLRVDEAMVKAPSVLRDLDENRDQLELPSEALADLDNIPNYLSQTSLLLLDKFRSLHPRHSVIEAFVTKKNRDVLPELARSVEEYRKLRTELVDKNLGLIRATIVNNLKSRQMPCGEASQRKYLGEVTLKVYTVIDQFELGRNSAIPTCIVGAVNYFFQSRLAKDANIRKFERQDYREDAEPESITDYAVDTRSLTPEQAANLEEVKRKVNCRSKEIKELANKYASVDDFLKINGVEPKDERIQESVNGEISRSELSNQKKITKQAISARYIEGRKKLAELFSDTL